MTYLKRCAWAGVIAAVAAGGATAQTTGTTVSPTGAVTTTTTGGGGGSTITGLQGASSTPQNSNAVQTPEITSTAGGFAQSAVQSSNIIGPYFANPLYQGLPSAAANPTGPGGFGQVLFSGTATRAPGSGGGANTTGRASTGATGRTGGTTGGLQGGTAGRTAGLGNSTGLAGSTLGSPTAGFGGSTGGLQGGTTTAAGRTGGLGATGRAGGLGNTGLGGGLGGANSTAQQLSTGRQVAYTQTLKFGVPPITTPQLQTDINTLVSTSPTLSGVNGLQTVVADGGLVVVRGKVADEDEARLVEGVIMLTPGVKGVRNELEFPKPPSP